ncbi:MAG TPA: YfiR family protein [Gemmatimonadales bacterium]|nr:YfiR family protein [Gemmatimonadales bacterium]
MALLRATYVSAAVLVASAACLQAQAARAAESQVKAVFLFNFAQFVGWPPAAFPDSGAPLVIGILGDDPVEGFLDQTVRGEQVRGRAFQVQRYHSVDEIKTCHVLFISRPSAARLDDVLASVRSKPILTVSDDDRFAERGGMVRFVTDHNRIRLQINLDAAQAASLTISSKLLRVAEIVTPPGR